MESIKDESELMEKIQEDIVGTEKQSIKIFAGHVPLLYHDGAPRQRKIELSTDRWGEFSPYSFDLGCQVLKFSKSQDRDSKLLLVVDDDVELPLIKDPGRIIRKSYPWAKKPRQRLLGEGRLPDEYRRILRDRGLLEDDLLKQDRGKGILTPLISEKILKRDARDMDLIAGSECALAYKGILLDDRMFDLEKDYLVSFMPGQCKGSICDGVLDIRDDLDATHIFFPHIEQMGGLFGTGEGYEKIGVPDTMEHMFSAGQIMYRKSVAK